MDARPKPPWPTFLCRLGWHAPRKGALWNQGYYFTRCTRCGADLVRTTFSGWEAPRGQRVVWRSRAELDQPDQRPNLSARATPSPRRTSLISPAAAPSRAIDRPPPPPPRRPAGVSAASAIPDFMDEPERPSTAGRERSVVEQREEGVTAGRRAKPPGLQ
ncbi:MAG TPA: hypothetical protein VEZ41_05835 [Allosphingosinicella sp.]|nr:hypothetical protein [Allosphingosinicella sp.]